MSIAVCCSQCGRMIYCSADNVDKRIACPGCGCIIETPHATFELSSGAEPTAVPCPCCGAVLRLMSSFAGKRVFCVSCNSALTISIDVLGILRIDKAETSPPTPTISRTDSASATTSGNLVYVSCSCGREVKFARTVVRDSHQVSELRFGGLPPTHGSSWNKAESSQTYVSPPHQSPRKQGVSIRNWNCRKPQRSRIAGSARRFRTSLWRSRRQFLNRCRDMK